MKAIKLREMMRANPDLLTEQNVLSVGEIQLAERRSKVDDLSMD